MSVSEIGHSGRYVINFYFHKVRQTHFSFPGSQKGFRSREEAESAQAYIRAKLLSNSKSGPLPIENSIIRSFFLDLADKRKPTTVYHYENSFRKYWLKYFEGLDLHSLEQKDLIRIAEEGLPSIEGSSTNARSSVIAFVKFLRTMNHDLDPTPFKDEKKNFEKRPRIPKNRIYSQWQFMQFLSKIEKAQDRAIFVFFFFFGLRLNELRGLRWCDIIDGWIHIRCQYCDKAGRKPMLIAPKTSKSVRPYPLEGMPLEVLSALPKGNDDEFIFKGASSKPIGESTLRRKVKQYAEMAGLHVIKIHGFRHSCATHMIKMGIEPRIVANWIGDTIRTTLEVYCDVQSKEKEGLIDKAFGF